MIRSLKYIVSKILFFNNGGMDVILAVGATEPQIPVRYIAQEGNNKIQNKENS